MSKTSRAASEWSWLACSRHNRLCTIFASAQSPPATLAGSLWLTSVCVGQTVPQARGVPGDIRVQLPQQLRNLNDQVLSLHALVHKAGPNEEAALHAQAA